MAAISLSGGVWPLHCLSTSFEYSPSTPPPALVPGQHPARGCVWCETGWIARRRSLRKHLQVRCLRLTNARIAALPSQCQSCFCFSKNPDLPSNGLSLCGGLIQNTSQLWGACMCMSSVHQVLQPRPNPTAPRQHQEAVRHIQSFFCAHRAYQEPCSAHAEIIQSIITSGSLFMKHSTCSWNNMAQLLSSHRKPGVAFCPSQSQDSTFFLPHGRNTTHRTHGNRKQLTQQLGQRQGQCHLERCGDYNFGDSNSRQESTST